MKVAQFRVEALNGAVGPRPPLIGLKDEAGAARESRSNWCKFVPHVAVVPSPRMQVDRRSGRNDARAEADQRGSVLQSPRA